METKEIRDLTLQLNGLSKADNSYIFYYDETNNIRKFYLKEDGFNESTKSNFLLGGIVLKKDQTVNLKPLFDNFKLQSNVKEVKLKHIAKGGFEDCIKSKKLNNLFKFLIDNKISIHYSTLNFLYFSTVDIIDSLITSTEIYYDQNVNRALKNDLYVFIKDRKNIITPFLYEFEYPNIKKERITDFINTFQKLIKKANLNIGLRTILHLLEKSKENGNLYFIMNEKDHELIEQFSHFYSRSIYIFNKSEHYFDEEDSIEPLINELKLTHEGNQLKNYEFIKSEGNLEIQLSDIIIGFLGKYYGFLNDNGIDEIKEKIKNFNSIQNENLKYFFNLLDMSNEENKAFIHQTISNDEDQKNYFFSKNYT